MNDLRDTADLRKLLCRYRQMYKKVKSERDAAVCKVSEWIRKDHDLQKDFQKELKARDKKIAELEAEKKEQ